MVKKKKGKEKSKKKRKGLSGTYWILVTILLAMIISPASAFLIGLGMLPSLLNMALLRGKGQQQKATILAMNAAGVFPFWFQLLADGDPLQRAIALSKDISAIAIMWGSAIVGMLIMWGGGKMAEAVIDIFARNRIEKLRTVQAKMIDEFGHDLEKDSISYMTGQSHDTREGGVDKAAIQD